jgi:hypothetical protein
MSKADFSPAYRGLSPADIYVLFADHGGKEKLPGFFRRQIWLNWQNEGGGAAIVERWNRLPEPMRRLIARGSLARKLPAIDAPGARGRLLVTAELCKARRERGPDWLCGPDAGSRCKHYWLSHLVLSWFGNVCYNTREVWEKLAAMPKGAKEILVGERKYPGMAGFLEGEYSD